YFFFSLSLHDALPICFVFVGDVRSLPLLPTFRVAVEAAKAPSRPATEVLARASQRALDEEELTIHPAFFTQFAAETSFISYVERSEEHTSELQSPDHL